MPVIRSLAFAVLVEACLGCGARSPLRDGDPGTGGEGATGAGGSVAAPCELVLAVPPTQAFADEVGDSESIDAHFTATASNDAQCMLALHHIESASTFALDQRCVHGFGAFDLGEVTTMGPPMQDDAIIPPADVFVAPGAGSGFAMSYDGGGTLVFAASVAVGDPTLPKALVTPARRIVGLGRPSDGGHFVLEGEPGKPALRGARLDANGALHDEQDLLCPSNNALAIASAHVGSSEIVVAGSSGGTLPDCVPVANTQAFVMRSTHSGASTLIEPLPGPLSALAITPFGPNEAFVVVSVTKNAAGELHVFRVDELGNIETQFNLGPSVLGFGVSAAEIGGALLVVQDAPRGLGAMDDSGFVAKLVDPQTGAITTRLSIPMPTNTVDSPAPPAMVSSSDGTETLLGFFVQPIGTGGRDFIARLDCH